VPCIATKYLGNLHSIFSWWSNNIAESYRVVGEKFPTKLPDVNALLNKLSYELITAPLSARTLIADPKDAPVLNAAILHEGDIIISGDKHFLQMDMKHPKVLKATEFLAIFDKDGQFTASQ
jgi:predicted nucleic acid-binding protein